MLDPDQYAAHLVMQGLADNTIRNYRPMFIRWIDYATAEGHDPYRPDPIAVRSWSQTINGTKSSLAHARAAMHHLCQALQTTDVSVAIPLPSEPKRQPKGLDHDTAVKLAATAETMGHKGIAALVGLYSFARRSEIASLAWRRVDFTSAKLTLQRPKNRDLHTVDLHPVLAQHLQDRWVAGEMWVFPGRHGGHVAPATVNAWIDDVSQAAGIGHVAPHMLRHTSITEAYEATGDLLATMNAAGHQRPETTWGYVRLSSQRASAAVSSLDYRQPA